jgi:rhodanese-related sulfurtransferase
MEEGTPMTRRYALLVVAALLLVAACGGAATATHTEAVETVAPGVVADLLDVGDHEVLDIRTPEEFGESHLAGAVNIDFFETTFAADIEALDRDASYVLYCKSGGRSGAAMELIRELGFTDVHEIDGGIMAWTEAGLSVTSP